MFTVRLNKFGFSDGFTLIELMIVISIIGMLAGVVMVSMRGARTKAQIARAQTDVSEIYKAIMLMEASTEKYPASNNISTAANFKKFVAPFLPGVDNDPWGHSYFYDGCPAPCTSCIIGGVSIGCETGAYAASVCSAGPDGILTAQNVSPRGDDICIYFEGGKSW